MSRTLIRPALAAVALAAALAGCSSTSTTTSAPAAPASTSSTTASAAPSSATSSAATSATSASGTTSAAASAVAISIKDFMFTVPASVPAGASITVTNNDNEAHTVTSKDGGFDVKVAGHGGTAQLTAPAKAGSYALTCDFHANMMGTLVVQ